MESMKGKWNGDVDLLDGKVEELRKQYDARIDRFMESTVTATAQCILKIVQDFKEDVMFLSAGLETAHSKYKEKYKKKSTAEEVLKNLSWEVVEHHTLVTQAQQLQRQYENALSLLEEGGDVPVAFIQLQSESKTYLKNLFKKKRQAADHVVVWMISDEKRNTKPYALPVGYIPCGTLRDQYVRDLNNPLKLAMKERGLKLAGISLYIF